MQIWDNRILSFVSLAGDKPKLFSMVEFIGATNAEIA